MDNLIEDGFIMFKNGSRSPKGRGIWWVEDVYEKFGAVCKEVDDTLIQGTTKYFETQFQSVGVNVQKFCTEFVNELIPDSEENPIKGGPLTDLSMAVDGFIKKAKAKEGLEKNFTPSEEELAQLAVSEACTNAVTELKNEHSLSGDSGIDVEGTCDAKTDAVTSAPEDLTSLSESEKLLDCLFDAKESSYIRTPSEEEVDQSAISEACANAVREFENKCSLDHNSVVDAERTYDATTNLVPTAIEDLTSISEIERVQECLLDAKESSCMITDAKDGCDHVLLSQPEDLVSNLPPHGLTKHFQDAELDQCRNCLSNEEVPSPALVNHDDTSTLTSHSTSCMRAQRSVIEHDDLVFDDEEIENSESDPFVIDVTGNFLQQPNELAPANAVLPRSDSGLSLSSYCTISKQEVAQSSKAVGFVARHLKFNRSRYMKVKLATSSQAAKEVPLSKETRKHTSGLSEEDDYEEVARWCVDIYPDSKSGREISPFRPSDLTETRLLDSCIESEWELL